MKKLITIITLLSSLAFASVLDECYKIFAQEPDALFMNAVAAISSSSKFQISEIQSKNGYILFLYGSKYYLLTVTKKYKNQTEIKILPQNSDYSQGSTVAQSVFALISAQIKSKPMEHVK